MAIEFGHAIEFQYFLERRRQQLGITLKFDPPIPENAGCCWVAEVHQSGAVDLLN